MSISRAVVLVYHLSLTHINILDAVKICVGLLISVKVAGFHPNHTFWTPAFQRREQWAILFFWLVFEVFPKQFYWVTQHEGKWEKKSFQIILREGNKLGFSTNISFKDDSGTISWIKECYFSAWDHQYSSLGLKINCVLRLHLMESGKLPAR